MTNNVDRKVEPIAWGSDLKIAMRRHRVALFPCPTCRRWFITKGKARYCSAACRQRAYRARKALAVSE